MSEGEERQPAPPGRPRGALAELLHTWRYFFWVLSLVLLVGLFYLEENWRGHWAWNRYRRQLIAQGEEMNAMAMVPPFVSPEQNFAETPLLAPLFRFIPGTQKWRDTNGTARASGFAPRYDAASGILDVPKTVRSNSWFTAPPDLALWYAAFLNTTNKGRHRPATLLVDTNFAPNEAATGVLAGLAEAEPVLDELRAASRLPHSRFDIRYDQPDPAGILLPHLNVLKHITMVLQLRASAELALGQTSEAFDDLELMLFLVNAMRDEPIMISQLVRAAQLQIALRTLAEGLNQWTEPQLRTLQERLLQFDFCTDFRRALAAERTFFGGGLIEFFRRSSDRFQLLGAISGDNGGGSAMAAAILFVAPDGWLSLEQRNYCRLFQDYILPTIDTTNQRVRPAAIRKADETVTALTTGSPSVLLLRHRFFAGLLAPALSRAVQKAAFAQTGANCAALAVAIERFRRSNGRLPTGLDDLKPDFIAKLPHDVINGRPLRYRLHEQGYVLYSVGWNEVDDNGVAVVPSERNSPTNRLDGDWVWRNFAPAATQ